MNLQGVELYQGDKVIRVEQGQLDYGEVLFAEEGAGSLVALWDNAQIPPEPLPPTQSGRGHSIGLYDRPLPVGSRVRHLGMEGQVYETRKLVTIFLAEQQLCCTDLETGRIQETANFSSNSSFPIILSRLKEEVLEPVWPFKIGDTVLYQGWSGVITSGKVEITFRFEDQGDTTISIQKDMKEIESCKSPSYVGLRIPNLTITVLRVGTWSRGFRPYNMIRYRNCAAIVYKLSVTSLEIMWVEKMTSTLSFDLDKNPQSPPNNVLDGKETLASVFVFADPSVEMFSPGSVFMMRWDDNGLIETYENWKERFTNEVLSDDNVKKPLPKKSKLGLPFSSRDRVAVKVLLYQTEADIIFNSGLVKQSLQSWRISQVLPHPSTYSLELFPMEQLYALGDVVKDIADFEHTHNTKYGFVVQTDFDKRTLLVNWIFLLGFGSCTQVKMDLKEVSLYDVAPINMYSSLKDRMKIVVAEGIFEGVVLNIKLAEGKISVRCAEGPIKSFYLHNIIFMNKKLFIAEDGQYEIRRTLIPKDLEIPAAFSCKNANSAVLQQIPNYLTKHRFFTTYGDHTHADHSFVTLPPQVEGDVAIMFDSYVQREVAFLRRSVSETEHNTISEIGWPVFIEKIGSERPDLHSVLVIGPVETMYENIPFILDIFLPFRFWDWEKFKDESLKPKVILRLPHCRVTPSWIHPELSDRDASINYPDYCLMSRQNQKPQGEIIGFMYNVVHYVTNTMLCPEPHLQFVLKRSISLGIGADGERRNYNSANNNNDNGNNGTISDLPISTEELHKSRHFNERAIIGLMDYVHTLLCSPPISWQEFLEGHFYENLPRIHWKNAAKILMGYDLNIALYAEDPEIQNVNIVSLNDSIGSKFLIHPVSQSFRLAIARRQNHLKSFLDAARVY